VKVTQRDLDRLMTGYNLSAEQVDAMVRREDSQFRILMDNHAACSALAARGGRYTCQAYEHRPGICREYECYILAGARDWMARYESHTPLDPGNPFHAARDEAELQREVETAIQRMRADNLADCGQLLNGAKGRVYENLPALMETLSGAEFEHTFPPR
jgi:Fe-S-cluster containining protein